MTEGNARADGCVVAPYDARRHRDVATMLARAFDADPLYRWFWPDQARRSEGLQAFIGAELSMTAAAGRVDVALDATGAVTGAALWALPGAYPFPLRHSAPPMLRLVPRLGLGFARRLPLMRRIDRQHPGEPHWYLITLGVDPERQGRGIGATLLRTGVRVADEGGIPVYLETFNPANPAYYRGHGFDEMATVTGGPLPAYWTMLRRPRPMAAP